MSKDKEMMSEEVTDGCLDGSTKHKHPAYGMLRFSRVQGGDPHLFGTDIKHDSKITLTLMRGSYERHLNLNWYYGGEELFEVEMSYTQFAELISSMNVGSGVPVTIRHMNHESMPRCPYINPVEVHTKEFSQHVSDTYEDTQKLIKEVSEIFSNKSSFNKKEREEITRKLNHISMNIGCNQSYAIDAFNEAVEHTVTESKGEIEAYFQQKMLQIANMAMVENPDLILGDIKSPVLLDYEEGDTTKRPKLKAVKKGDNHE